MERHICSVAIVLFAVSIFWLAPAHAVNQINVLAANCIIGSSDLQSGLGQYVQSKSYVRLGSTEYIDSGFLVNTPSPHLQSSAGVIDGYHDVSAFSAVPMPQGGSMQCAGLLFTVDVDEFVNVLGWTNAQSIYSPQTNESITIECYPETAFSLPSGLYGNVKVYFGIWKDDGSAGNLMLDEKDGWTQADLSFEGQTYRLLERTFTTEVYGSSSTWSLDLEAGEEYRLFTYMVGEVVPEPATLLLLSAGAFLIQRKQR